MCLIQKQDKSLKDRWQCLLSNKWTASILVFALALTVRMVHIHEATQSPLMGDTFPMHDSRYYDKVAQEVAEGDILGDEVFYMAPLYPYMMAIPYRLFLTQIPDGTYDYSVTIVRYLQCMLGAVSCVLIYWVGRLMIDRWVGLLAGLMASIYGILIYYDGVIMATSCIVFFHLLALLVLLISQRCGSFGWWITSGVVLGICAVAHGTVLLVVVGVMLWVLISFAKVRGHARLKYIALLLLGFIPIVLIVTVRNYVVGKEFALLTSNTGKNLYIGNNPTATGSFKFYSSEHWGSNLSYYLKDVKRKADDVSPSELSRILSKKAFEFILQHPLEEVMLLAKKLRLFFNTVEVGGNDNYYFAKHYSKVLRWNILAFGIIGPIGLTGVFYGIKQWRKYLLLLVFMASQVISFTIMFVLGRYRLVFVACIIVFAAGQIVSWCNWLWKKNYRRTLVSLIPLAFFVLCVHFPVSGFNKTRGFGQQYQLVGNIYFRNSNYEMAREAFENAVMSNFDPWNGTDFKQQCYTRLGIVNERLQNWSSAYEAYEQGLWLSRNGANVINNEQVNFIRSRMRILRDKKITQKEPIDP